MSRAGALVLTAAVVLWVRSIGTIPAASSAGTALVLGFMLVGAWLTGDVLRRFNLPRLTGYLLFGILIGPSLSNVVTISMAGQLQFVTGIATTLIALIAGLTLNIDRLGWRFMPIVTTTALTLFVPMVGLVAVGWVAWPWLPIAGEAHGMARLAMVALVATMAVSFSPTMTAAIITDTGARGRLSDLVLAMVVLADLVLLAVFALVLQLARVVFATDAGAGPPILVQLTWEIGAAIAFGALIGSLFGLYLRFVGREVALVLLAVGAVLSQVGSTQQFEPLLAAVAAGLVIENLAPRQGDALRLAVREAAPPILVVFFVAVGASLRLDAVASIGFVAIALSVARLGLIRLGVRAGLRATGFDEPGVSYAWTGLISQAGITLGLASIVAAEFPGWGAQVQLLLVGSIAINELFGPIIFRQGLLRSGDLGQPPSRPMVVVSNREPYMHEQKADGTIAVRPTTGGVAVALDALMRERSGVWIAHGAGPADRLVVDAHDKVAVPPDKAMYTLRRLWIEEPTFNAYYGGFANEGLWPLCHAVDVRPKFRADDWHAYEEVNARFARAIDEELGDTNAPVFIQDYHLTRVSAILRRRRPHARTAIFWHIPWPYPDRLRICPWRREILSGLLANDLIAFQLERDRRNFLAAVGDELDAEVDDDASQVHFAGRTSSVVSVPIGVDFDRIQLLATDAGLAAEQARLIDAFGLRARHIGLGVDRLDYTKGIPERLAALDELVSARADLRGTLTFLQIGVPSRSSLDSYAAVEHEIARMVRRLNEKHAAPGGAPLVVLSTDALGAFSLTALYRLSNFCVVSSLHDGMNLVAKEFVAARDDERGVLVLSELAGAAQELDQALIINPYDLRGFARALAAAIDMPVEEQMRRMSTMRKVVAGRNVFSWASDILEGLESLWTKPLLYSVRGWEDTSV